MSQRKIALTICLFALCVSPAAAAGQTTRQTSIYRRIKAYLDSIPAIDTHDHLRPFDQLPGYVQTERGNGMNLYGLLNTSYYQWINPLTAWRSGENFSEWWAQAKHNFDNARATNFYRYLLPAFQDLYGIDFNRLTDEQAEELDRRVFENYKDTKWLNQVITERANIELMLNDPYWARLDFRTFYKFGVLVFDVNPLIEGFHPSEFKNPWDDPYRFAREHQLAVTSIDDYLAVLDRLFQEAKQRGAVCLKSDIAYERTLEFERVPKEQAARVFGRPRSELTPQKVKEFEDFIMWRLAELSAKYDLPFQFHTGDARLQGSSPMLLMNLIEANPHTKFILFHGGYPWIGETGAIVFTEMSRAANVWIDSCWLPTISYTMAKRAYHEWLEVMPSNRIMWGADLHHAEGIYAATEFTRRCLAEVLAEKVERGDIAEDLALRIGKQIMRDNALELFPQLKARLWKTASSSVSPAENR